MAFTLDQAELVGAQAESLVYGIYLICFPVSLYLLFSRSVQGAAGNVPINPILVFGTILLFILVSSHWLVDQLRLWGAFIIDQHKEDGAFKFYALLSDARNIARTIIFSLEILTLDSLLLYRLYIIWSRNIWVLVVPAISLIGSTVTGVVICLKFSQAPPGVPVFDLPVSHWITATFACTITTNILAVGLIAFRIIRRNSKLHGPGVTKLSSTITIVVESAAVYCILTLATMIALVASSPLQFTFLAITSPATGISFTLITLRVKLARTFTSHIVTDTTRDLRVNPDYLSGMPMRVRVTQEAPITVVEDKPYDNLFDRPASSSIKSAQRSSTSPEAIGINADVVRPSKAATWWDDGSDGRQR